MNFKNSSRVENHKGFNLQKPQIQKLFKFLKIVILTITCIYKVNKQKQKQKLDEAENNIEYKN